jgi:preprotein translocase subunit SecG
MLYGILVTLFTIMCLLLILVILIQKGKSSMGLGSLGGGSQMLFGGSGGQDVFQKATWVMGALFMAGSLGLALMKKPSQSTILSHLSAKIEAEKNSKPVTVAVPENTPSKAAQADASTAVEGYTVPAEAKA